MRSLLTTALAMGPGAAEYLRARRLLASAGPAEHDAMLADLLRHAAERVPYYRGHPAYGPATPASYHTLPVLEKRVVRERRAELASDDAARLGARGARTTGSTGMPLEFLVDRAFGVWKHAAMDHFVAEFLGLDPARTRQAVFWYLGGRGRPRALKRVHLALRGTTVEDVARCDPEDMDRFASTLAARRPGIVVGFPYMLCNLARHIRARGIAVPAPRFVVTMSEPLHPGMRAELGEVFGCPVRDVYASSETGPLAGECAHGRLHVFEAANRVEPLDAAGRAAPPGTPARMVVTNLHNSAMPLLRYALGDTVEAASGPCACGRAGMALTRVVGRVIDHLVRADGVLVEPSHLLDTMTRTDWLDEYRMVQQRDGRIEITFTRRREPSDDDKARVAARIREVMGPKCVIAFTPVEVLPSDPGGKHHFIRSTLLQEPQPSNR